jgi:hypothetical protein
MLSQENLNRNTFLLRQQEGKGTTDKNAKDEYWELRNKEMKSKYDIELSRYKQDCRKRALEIANSQILRHGDFFKENDFVNNSEDKKPVPPVQAEHDLLIGRADVYYKWLIEIE